MVCRSDAERLIRQALRGQRAGDELTPELAAARLVDQIYGVDGGVRSEWCQPGGLVAVDEDDS